MRLRNGFVKIEKKKETTEDVRYDARQKRKLQKEIKQPRRKKDPMLQPSKKQKKIEEERKMVEEFVRKNKEAPETSELVEKYTQPDKKMCMTKGHQNEPATVQISHSGLLGEDVPPLTFCKWCEKLFKFFPLGETKKSHKVYLYALNKLANKLDKLGLYEDADIIDGVLSK